MNLNLESLGFTKDELQDRVIDQICEQVMTGRITEEDGEPCPLFRNELEKKIKENINERIDMIANKYVLPDVGKYIEGLCLQKTNEWGEKKGGEFTFTEYLIQKANDYLKEEVDYNGKSKKESGGYSWTGRQTRITHLVHNHMQYSIETAMKEAVKTANDSIANGIQEAVKIKLGEIVEKLKVNVNTG
jgi:hypothetical protein